MLNSSIRTIDRILSGATTPDQSGPEVDDNEGVLSIAQSSGMSKASPSDCLVSHLGHSAEMHSVYFAAPGDWAQWCCS